MLCCAKTLCRTTTSIFVLKWTDDLITAISRENAVSDLSTAFSYENAVSDLSTAFSSENAVLDLNTAFSSDNAILDIGTVFSGEKCCVESIIKDFRQANIINYFFFFFFFRALQTLAEGPPASRHRWRESIPTRVRV